MMHAPCIVLSSTCEALKILVNFSLKKVAQRNAMQRTKSKSDTFERCWQIIL